MSVTAEGAETDAQLTTLKAMHSDHAQGFLLGRPMPESQVSQVLADPSTASAEPNAALPQQHEATPDPASPSISNVS
jgi:predicted signal transduction protein with EAL and GGDEF domain